jgi:hypothetical protein
MIKTYDLKDYLESLDLSFPAASYSRRRTNFRDIALPSQEPSPGVMSRAAAMPAPTLSPAPLLKAGLDQTMIVDRSLISFVSEVSVDNRADVLESTLLAQLGAKNKIPDETDVIGWYEAYIDILSKLGWTVEGGEVQHFSANANVVELQSVIIDILMNAFGAGFIQIIKKALDAVKSLADSSGKIEAFEKNTHSESTGSFQIGVATEENGAVSINLGTFLITTSNKIKNILFIKFSKDETDLQYASGKLTLDQNIYGEIRKLVQQKLSSRATEFVAEIVV